MEQLKELEEMIAYRKKERSVGSYTCRLLGSITLAPRKVSEEAYEVCEAALMNDREGLKEEAADLLYHLMVLLGQKDVTLEEVLAVLEGRRS